jgi:hypothetical protein
LKTSWAAAFFWYWYLAAVDGSPLGYVSETATHAGPVATQDPSRMTKITSPLGFIGKPASTHAGLDATQDPSRMTEITVRVRVQDQIKYQSVKASIPPINEHKKLSVKIENFLQDSNLNQERFLLSVHASISPSIGCRSLH